MTAEHRRLVVLTLSTDDCRGARNCFATLSWLGYEWYAVNRGRPFRGWSHRTRQYIDAIRSLKRSDSDVFVLCDANDLFFVRPPADLLAAFDAAVASSPAGTPPVIVGAEPACCNGKYGSPEGKGLAHKGTKALVADSRYRYSNGGFVCGVVGPLLKLLEGNVNEGDDQAGYLDKFINQPGKWLDLDRYQRLVGNMPNMHSFYMPPDHDKSRATELDHWRFDADARLWRSVHFDTSPCAFHFPGRYWHGYNSVARTMWPDKYIADGHEQCMLVPDEPLAALVPIGNCHECEGGEITGEPHPAYNIRPSLIHPHHHRELSIVKKQLNVPTPRSTWFADMPSWWAESLSDGQRWSLIIVAIALMFLIAALIAMAVARARKN